MGSNIIERKLAVYCARGMHIIHVVAHNVHNDDARNRIYSV